MKQKFYHFFHLAARQADFWLLLMLLTAATPVVFRRQNSLYVPAPRIELLDHSWLLDTSYKAATGVWFGRDVTFTYGPLFQWLSSAPARFLGVSTGVIFATWYMLPLFVVILATFFSARLLFQSNQYWKRALFLLLAVVFWSLPDVRASVSLLAFLIFLRLVDEVASNTRSQIVAAGAASLACITCFLLSADSGVYSVAAFLLTVAATCAVRRKTPKAIIRVLGFAALTAGDFMLLMLVINAVIASPMTFNFWHSSLAVASSYRWFEALGMARSDKHMLFLALAAGIVVFVMAWYRREPEGTQWTLRPNFLLSGFWFAFLMMQSGLVRSDSGHVLLAIFPMVFLGGAVLIGGRSSAPVMSAVTLSATVIITLILAHPYGAFTPYSLEVRAKQIAHPPVSCSPGDHLFDQACLQGADAELLAITSSYIDQHTTNGDSIVVFPYQTLFGLTARRKVAGGVLQSYLVDGAYLTNLELTGLQQATPSFGLYFPDGTISPRVDGVPNFTRSPELFFYLLRHYRSVTGPEVGIVGLVRDGTRDSRLRLISRSLVRVPNERRITSHNTWLDLGAIAFPEAGLDFLRLRLKVSYSCLWRIRKPSSTAVEITFADGSRRLFPFVVEPNRTSEVWLDPWNEAGNYFAPDESQWRSSSRVPITRLKLFVRRYDWISVVPNRVAVDSVDAVRISMVRSSKNDSGSSIKFRQD